MTLQFESPNKTDLESVDFKPKLSDTEALENARTQLQTRIAEERMAAIENLSPVTQRDISQTWVSLLRKEQEEIGITSTPTESNTTTIGPVTPKAQPAADPSTPSTTSPPPTTYTRTVTLGLRGRSADQIFSYFKRVTKARQFYRGETDKKAKRRMDRFFAGAEKDRQRVKAGIDAIRREKADLKRAREAAEQMAADA